MRTFYDESELDTVGDGEFVKMHLELEEDLKKEMGIFKEDHKVEAEEEDVLKNSQIKPTHHLRQIANLKFILIPKIK
ncbi:hypothetical protein [Clostridium tertium]|uniref:hypothetical protein n=1 Tax=Clostridium tertium TaxID=1559 RepID=UPI0024B38EC2|nr:hypothetical protein [Clostridium tertium]MDI9216584.1 hypothetical protein [Clostridium tertium]